MKHVFVNSEQNKTITNGDYRHMDHCVEYIRQVCIMLRENFSCTLTELTDHFVGDFVQRRHYS
jgi:hypothetical protein